MDLTKQNLFDYIKKKDNLLKEIESFQLTETNDSNFKKIVVCDCLFENLFRTKVYVDYKDFIENEKTK